MSYLSHQWHSFELWSRLVSSRVLSHFVVSLLTMPTTTLYTACPSNLKTVMSGVLRQRQGLLGFYILGETWKEKQFVVVHNTGNPTASVFGATNVEGRPIASIIYASEIRSLQAVRDGRFMDEMGTMIRCRHPFAFEITYIRFSRSNKMVLSAPDFSTMDRWLAALRNILALRDRHLGHCRTIAPSGYPASQPGASVAMPAPAHVPPPYEMPPSGPGTAAPALYPPPHQQPQSQPMSSYQQQPPAAPPPSAPPPHYTK
eukprot:m.148620 g.148620  ORF g.148620 m.148620 type:complete len:258 (+) comp23209_c0_seq3:61-834(+)